MCTCNNGYKGNGITCQDIDECITNNLNVCSNNSNCVNTNGSYDCLCNTGFSGNGLISCTDIDECSNNLDNCHTNAQCINSVGSYTCQCNNGYVGDGRTCNDVDECLSELNRCSIHAYCNNTIGSYTCQCNIGFSGNGISCNDINECTTETYSCSIYANCNNTIGSYMCTCNNGYKGNGITCQDIDECITNNLNVCSNNSNCVNTNGSYDCLCNTGFSGNGLISCTDIDECSNNLDNCHTNAQCINSVGSYTCQCNNGYVGDGRTCNDVDECLSEVHRCSIHAYCNNTIGSYTCQCNIGFSGNGISCNDINECTTETYSCSIYANCNNTIGSYMCTCNNGYKGNGITCQDIDECITNNLNVCSNNSSCVNTNGSYDCLCNTGFSGNGLISCTDIDECSNNLDNCHTNAQCINTLGSFRCRCKSGYYGNGISCTPIVTCYGNNNCDTKASCLIYNNNYYCSYGQFSATSRIFVSQYSTFNPTTKTAEILKNATSDINQYQSFIAIHSSTSNNYGLYDTIVPDFNATSVTTITCATGNYGKKGRWMYRVDDPSINHINYAQRCRTWFVNEPLPDVYLNELLRRLCPCSILQAIRDRRFRLNLNTFYVRSRFSRRVSIDERVYQRCCCSSAGKSFGSLITRYPFGSSFIFRNTTLQARNNEALTDCCMRSSLCSLYLKKRPINKCVGYKAPRKAWFWGDPHVRTFDGKLYTFNELGEYILLQTINKNFQLQGRTMKAIRNSSLSAAATVFSAFATMEIGADIVQFTLNSTFNGIDILVNRTISFNMDSLSENETREFNNVDVTRLSNITVAAIFTSGVSMEVTLLTQMLTIAFNGPDEIKGITSGLLGTWNDNINDDFKRPNGSYLNINSTESQIFYNFGQLWMINASDSLFTYPNGLSASNYSDSNFTPIFGQNIQALFANNTELYNQAVA
ncbi:uncharacterized protein TRIADDRAFT_62718 [Trichoplax adhaerens]|uniref:Uncharacterized protein n=1 Tax=Trichoplax adhaerens TaxID=10228 RepID=B3SEN2_TRIAD|nr:hypothetical protein TRIADDRAFT_62718 [Trichoplax adhaerens]EDV18814.1 hypothetical protein TRIADDRAFT_62718 [Trichoplax adhaerens]|eukprot:XP_002118701.1 hypothetical protein TRIADDRAFT_62718 [Trichoplax adhaerens]